MYILSSYWKIRWVDKYYVYMHVHKNIYIELETVASLEVTMGQKDISEVSPKVPEDFFLHAWPLSNE